MKNFIAVESIKEKEDPAKTVTPFEEKAFSIRAVHELEHVDYGALMISGMWKPAQELV